MIRKILMTTAVASPLFASSVCFAGNAWTQLDCGGLNETLQASEPLAAGTTKLTEAEFLTFILGNKATYGWPKGRPMSSNRYVGADVKSVTPLQIPDAAAAYLIVFTSKNHYPDTQVVCTFTDVRE